MLLRGSEGTSVDGKTVSLRGRDDINLTTVSRVVYPSH